MPLEIKKNHFCEKFWLCMGSVFVLTCLLHSMKLCNLLSTNHATMQAKKGIYFMLRTGCIFFIE